MSAQSDVEYTPIETFASPTRRDGVQASVFGSPGRYAQGDGVIDHGGHYLSRLGFGSALVLLSQRSLGAEGERLLRSFDAVDVRHEVALFGGECSLEEIEGHVAAPRAEQPDVLVAVGGGKAVDAGRAIAHRMAIPCIVVPSLASNDAPCAALSVIYTAEGVTLDAEIYPQNPALVLMDTGVVAQAGERYLAAGMADAMATWYEARATQRNPMGINVFGGRPTRVGTAIAKLCMETLFEHGEAALAAVRDKQVNEALEAVVEANTLMSGLGYESGGLAVAHALAQGFTVLENVHRDALHGEMVAVGTLTQLVLERDEGEAQRVAAFFASAGLPVTLAQLGVNREDEASIAGVIEAAMAFPFLGNMVEAVTAEALTEALARADMLGGSLLS